MKKIFVLFSLCAMLFAWNSVSAQENKEAHHCSQGHAQCSHQCQQPKLLTPNSIAMLKEEFFKENLKLNDNQKDAFWKSYNKYEAAKKQANENEKTAKEKAGIPAHHGCKSHGNCQMTDQQKVKAYNIQLEKRQALLSAEQTFFKEISKNLTDEQIAQYLGLEKAFQMEMAKLKGSEYGHHQGQPKNPHHNSGPRQEIPKAKMDKAQQSNSAPVKDKSLPVEQHIQK